MTHTFVRLAAAFVLTTSLAAAQSGGASSQEIRTLEPSDLTMHQYTPQHISAGEAVRVLSSAYGRSYLLPSSGGRASFNLQSFGRTVLIIDEAVHAERVLDVVKQLDVAPPKVTLEPMVVETIDVENISVESAQRALHVLGSLNLQPIFDGGQIVVSDTRDRVKQVKSLLAEIDKPAPRILLQCMIVQAEMLPVDESLAVPTALSDNLAKLVNYSHFEMVTQGMLTGVAEAGKPLSIELPAAEYPSEIRLTLGSFDDQSESLTLSQCEIQMGTQKIRTSAVIRSGEYLVLCATGRKPLFTVLRMSTID